MLWESAGGDKQYNESYIDPDSYIGFTADLFGVWILAERLAGFSGVFARLTDFDIGSRYCPLTSTPNTLTSPNSKPRATVTDPDPGWGAWVWRTPSQS